MSSKLDIGLPMTQVSFPFSFKPLLGCDRSRSTFLSILLQKEQLPAFSQLKLERVGEKRCNDTPYGLITAWQNLALPPNTHPPTCCPGLGVLSGTTLHASYIYATLLESHRKVPPTSTPNPGPLVGVGLDQELRVRSFVGFARWPELTWHDLEDGLAAALLLRIKLREILCGIGNKWFDLNSEPLMNFVYLLRYSLSNRRV